MSFIIHQSYRTKQVITAALMHIITIAITRKVDHRTGGSLWIGRFSFIFWIVTQKTIWFVYNLSVYLSMLYIKSTQSANSQRHCSWSGLICEFITYHIHHIQRPMVVYRLKHRPAAPFGSGNGFIQSNNSKILDLKSRKKPNLFKIHF